MEVAIVFEKLRIAKQFGHFIPGTKKETFISLVKINNLVY